MRRYQAGREAATAELLTFLVQARHTCEHKACCTLWICMLQFRSAALHTATSCRCALVQATGCQMDLSAEQVDAGEVDKLVQGIVQCANEVLQKRCSTRCS